MAAGTSTEPTADADVMSIGSSENSDGDSSSDSDLEIVGVTEGSAPKEKGEDRKKKKKKKKKDKKERKDRKEKKEREKKDRKEKEKEKKDKKEKDKKKKEKERVPTPKLKPQPSPLLTLQEARQSVFGNTNMEDVMEAFSARITGTTKASYQFGTHGIKRGTIDNETSFMAAAARANVRAMKNSERQEAMAAHASLHPKKEPAPRGRTRLATADMAGDH